MTVCMAYFDSNIKFWIILIVSILVIGYLTLYLPISKLKSKWKYSFILLFVFLMFFAFFFNFLLVGVKSTCDGLWDRHYVTDYNRSIDSFEEAHEIYRELAYDMFEQGRNLGNDADNAKWLENTLNRTRFRNNMYYADFDWTCYELYTNGTLYKYWCGA